jgi:hypothetical protein
MPKNKDKKAAKIKVDEVVLYTYPKVIFFYPLFFTSFVLWLIQMFISNGPINLLGYIWIAVFFINLFVCAFDFNSSKFFILVMVIAVIILLIVFLVIPNIEMPSFEGEFNIGLKAEFYLIMTIILGLILSLVVVGTRFDYWRIERNEIYHKSGLLGDSQRYPVDDFQFKKEIPDIFELIALKAGSITLIPDKDTVIHLNTIININRKVEQLDYLLSHKHVEVDQLD